jgi:hypothetical protein
MVVMSEGYDVAEIARGAIRTPRPVARCRVRSRSMDLLAFECPRCRTAVEERLYGPCESCRTDLRARFVTEARIVELAEYEPKMNVTPNAVALKDD